MKRYKIIVIVTMMCLIIGCGKKEAEIPKDISSKETESGDTIETEEKENNEFSDLDLTTTPDINTLTRDEFKELSVEDIRKIVATYIEDYRLTYDIANEYEMQESDWNTLKSIMEYQLFGVEDTDISEAEERRLLESTLSDTEKKYLLPSAADIREMTPNEFATWFNEASVYYADQNYNASAVDLHEFTEEQIKEVQEQYIILLEENN